MDIDFNGKILINKINHLNANNNNVPKNNNSSSSSNRSNSDISNKSNHSNYNNNKSNNSNSNKTILKSNKRFNPAASNNNNNSGDSVIRNESSKKTTTFNIPATSSHDKINGVNVYGISNKYSKAANNNLNINNNTNHKDINNDFFFFNNNLNIGHKDINNNFFNKTPTVGPRLKSLKRNQLSIVLNTIPCNELFHWLVTNDVFTQKIVDNLQETYKTKRSINEAMIDLLIIYGEWAVLRFSHALLFTGQKEMHQLLEDGAGL
ncbi:hypothetical protein HELRODRAFT_184179 [Helobdella robusta]|uniref:CARD domain-containing protein n=1 Tax=Helobdella robusta TaxID=6412 RepID=T1FKQ4_HELRO|nr:hypothetical protein HELRODRAFT_184179 [Helobdella robusta]ESO06741.1 hypothetical protein HELRODRAFT_184179 [Helobdella robusta]